MAVEMLKREISRLSSNDFLSLVRYVNELQVARKTLGQSSMDEFCSLAGKIHIDGANVAKFREDSLI